MSVSYEKSLSMVQTSCGLAVWGSPHCEKGEAGLQRNSTVSLPLAPYLVCLYHPGQKGPRAQRGPRVGVSLRYYKKNDEADAAEVTLV